MRITISLPDDLFKAADLLAEELGIPRSQLYSRAVAEYVAKSRGAGLTARLNAVYGDEESGLDAALRRAQRRSLGSEQW